MTLNWCTFDSMIPVPMSQKYFLSFNRTSLNFGLPFGLAVVRHCFDFYCNYK